MSLVAVICCSAASLLLAPLPSSAPLSPLPVLSSPSRRIPLGPRRTVPSEFPCLPPHTHTDSVHLVFRAHSTHSPCRSHYARTRSGRLVPASRFGNTLHATSQVHPKSASPIEASMHASDRALIILLSPHATQHVAPVSAFARAGCHPLVFSFAQQRAHHPVYFLPLDLQVRTLQRVSAPSPPSLHFVRPPSRILPVLSPISSPVAPAAVVFCPPSLNERSSHDAERNTKFRTLTRQFDRGRRRARQFAACMMPNRAAWNAQDGREASLSAYPPVGTLPEAGPESPGDRPNSVPAAAYSTDCPPSRHSRTTSNSELTSQLETSARVVIGY